MCYDAVLFFFFHFKIDKRSKKYKMENNFETLCRTITFNAKL